MELILIGLAPVMQIILITARLRKKIVLPIGAVTVLAMFVGIMIIVSVSSRVNQSDHTQQYRPHYSMDMVAFFLYAFFINLIAIPIIGIFGGLIWHFNNKGKAVIENA